MKIFDIILLTIIALISGLSAAMMNLPFINAIIIGFLLYLQFQIISFPLRVIKWFIIKN